MANERLKAAEIKRIEGAKRIRIFEEKLVVDYKKDAVAMLRETEELWKQTEGYEWERVITDDPSIQLEKCLLGGVFESSNVQIFRSQKVIDAPPAEVYELLNTEGAACVLNPNLVEMKPILKADANRLQIEVLLWKRKISFPYSDREFLTMDVTNRMKWQWVSKSIMHPDIDKGKGSKYATNPIGEAMCMMCQPEASSVVRGYQTLAIQVTPEKQLKESSRLGPRGKSIVNVICFRDLCGEYPKFLTKKQNISLHIELYKYLEGCLDESDGY